MIGPALDDSEFRQWLRGHPAPAMLTGSGRDLQVRRTTATGIPESGRPEIKHWTAFEAAGFGMAVNSDGVVVLRGLAPRRFRLWILPNGGAGTSSRTELKPHQSDKNLIGSHRNYLPEWGLVSNRWFPVSGNLSMAFCGEAVFLEAAVGFVRDGALDESGFERGDEVAFPEMFPVG